jgi:hypothetical protein
MSSGLGIIAAAASLACVGLGACSDDHGSNGPAAAARQVPSADSLPAPVSASCKAPTHMKTALKRLLDDLDEILERHEEVGDTDVREQMYVAIRKGFIMPEAGYVVPSSFGMFSWSGNRRVRVAIARFLADPELVSVSQACQTPQARLDWFQDSEVRSSTGTVYDEFFGYAEKP